MQLNAYLTFPGNCAAAFKFYEKALGGKIQMIMTHGQSPMADQVSPDWRDKVIHASMTIGNFALMGSDAPPNMFEKPQGFSVSFTAGNAAEAERIFKALADKATIKMPLQETFWAPRFGTLVDQFGIPWMIGCEPAAG